MITLKTKRQLGPIGRKVMEALDRDNMSLYAFCAYHNLNRSNLVRTLKSAKPHRMTLEFLSRELGVEL